MCQRYYVMPVICTCDISFDLLLSDQIFAFLNFESCAKNSFPENMCVAKKIDLCRESRESI